MSGKYLLDTNIVIALFAADDIWIAAVAIEHDLTLVTRDEHFTDIDGLRRQSWC
jgi:predicted nucleic acid-binding protein